MAGRTREPGPTSIRVARNLRSIRQERGLSYAEMARRLAAIDHPIIDTGLLKIEKEERRVDVDDLIALAVVLGVTPSTILFPREADDSAVELAPGVSHPASAVWSWADGDGPLPPGPGEAGQHEPGAQWQRSADFQRHARPHGGNPEPPPPMIQAIYELLTLWNIAYKDWANPETWRMRVGALDRAAKRLMLRSEDELDRLRHDGEAAERGEPPQDAPPPPPYTPEPHGDFIPPASWGA